jgi:hypothetical protein
MMRSDLIGRLGPVGQAIGDLLPSAIGVALRPVLGQGIGGLTG